MKKDGRSRLKVVWQMQNWTWTRNTSVKTSPEQKLEAIAEYEERTECKNGTVEQGTT
jgi:hypothetical protein